MKKLFVSSLISLAIVSLLLPLVPVALAGNPEQATLDAASKKINDGFGKDLVTAKPGEDPTVTTQKLAGGIIQKALGIIGTIALIVFLYSGIMWMLAGDNAGALTKAKQSMIWAAIGLFAIFGSYMIIAYVIKAVAF